MKKILFLLAIATISAGAVEVDFRNYQLKDYKRPNGNIVWNITYNYNARDTKSPRVLLVGDSICNGYRDHVRNMLAQKVNICFWATSLCITSRSYLKMLDFVLSSAEFDLIIFNNALHSLSTDRNKWYEAYNLCLDYIGKKAPDTKIVILNATPKKDDDKRVDELNSITAKIASERKLPLADIHSFCAGWDREIWRDAYHFNNKEKKKQAAFVSGVILKHIPADRITGNLKQLSTETGPDGKLK